MKVAQIIISVIFLIAVEILGLYALLSIIIPKEEKERLIREKGRRKASLDPGDKMGELENDTILIDDSLIEQSQDPPPPIVEIREKTQKVVDAVLARSNKGSQKWTESGTRYYNMGYDTEIGGEVFRISRSIYENKNGPDPAGSIIVEILTADTHEQLLSWNVKLSDNNIDLSAEERGAPLSLEIFELWEKVKKIIDDEKKREEERQRREWEKQRKKNEKRLDSFMDNI